MIDLDINPGRRGLGLPQLAAAAAVLILLGGTGYYTWRPSTARGLDDCPAGGPTGIHVLGVDITDPHTLANPTRTTATIKDLLRELPQDTRLAIVPIDDRRGTEITPVYVRCAPPRDVDVDPTTAPMDKVRREREAFEKDAQAAVSNFTQSPPAAHSPLASQLTRVVTEKAIIDRVPVGAPRKLTILGDLLEFSEAGNAYRQPLHLPDPPERIFEGWSIRFIQATNPAALARQNDLLRSEWRRWTGAGGVRSVSFEGSGFVDLR